MKAVDLAGIRIEGNVSLQNIESVYIKTGLNRHGFCQIQAVVDENGYDGKPEMILKMENFKIIYETGQKKLVLFAGYVQELDVSVEAGLYRILISGASHSKKTDQKQESHSYQDISMDYRKLLNMVMGNDGNCILSGKDNPVTGTPLIQFQSTKWEFLCQIAERLCLPVIPSSASEGADIRIGAGNGEVHTLRDIQYRKMTIDYRNRNGSGDDRLTGGCICYEVEVYDFLRLGDWVELDGAKWLAAGTETVSRGGFITHKYLLVQEAGIPYLCKQEKRSGHYSLSGTVLWAGGNRVKLHLDIDENQDIGTAYPYEYYPVTGSVMYAVPEPGARAVLHVTEHFPGGGIVTECIPDRDGRRRPRQKQLGTVDDRQILMGTGNLLFTSGGRETLSLDDGDQILVQSEKPVQIEAEETVRMEAGGGVSIGAQAFMQLSQSSTANRMVFSGNGIVHSAVRHNYASGVQSPKKPEERAEGPVFSGMELAGELFGLFASGNMDPLERAFMESQPMAASPDRGKWKKIGKGFGTV